MARQEGTYKLGSNIEPKMNAPLDARLVVPTRSDLFLLEYFYKGMVVSVSAGGLYQLTGDDPTLEESWASVGGDSGSVLEPRVAAIENGDADIKHTITAHDVESIFNDEFANPSSSYGEGYAVGVYIRETGTQNESDWFSKTDGGDAFTPEEKTIYIVLSDGDYHWYLYEYRDSLYRRIGEAESAILEEFYGSNPTTTTILPELSPNTIRNGKWDDINFNNGVILDRSDSYTGGKDNTNFTKTLGAIRCSKAGEKFVFNFRYDINAPIVANRRGIFIRYNGTVIESLPMTNGVITEINREIISTPAMVGKDIALFYGKNTSSNQNNNRTWLYGGTIKKYESATYYKYISSSRLNANSLVKEIARATRQNTVGDSSDSATAVQTKSELYSLTNTYRGMIVYVIDEDKHYKLINDLPAYEASWTDFVPDGFIEMTDAEIDALFV